MNIDLICNDGSPLGIQRTDIHGENGRIGLGGAELALMTLCDGWHESGHHVRLYNNPKNTVGQTFAQLPLDSFEPNDNRDILIIFRSPNIRSYNAKGLKVWWSCDQYTVGSYKDFSKTVDKIVTISPFHANYFRETYEIDNTITIDLPVRTWEYEPIEKVKNRLIFCSVPERGLGVLAKIYDVLLEKIPNISLAITSDYRLWGMPTGMNEHYIAKFLGKSGVRFLGAIPRGELIKEQLQAQILAYPCTYDELFCYAVAECSVAGAYPITPPIGALSTTNMGTLLDGNPEDMNWQKQFVDEIENKLTNQDELENRSHRLQSRSIKRFSLDRVLNEWERVFNE